MVRPPNRRKHFIGSTQLAVFNPYPALGLPCLRFKVIILPALITKHRVRAVDNNDLKMQVMLLADEALTSDNAHAPRERLPFLETP